MGLDRRFIALSISLYLPKSITVLVFMRVVPVQPLKCRYASAGGLVRVKAALMSAGNKCPATAFANCRDRSSDVQTNKCGVWVSGESRLQALEF